MASSAPEQDVKDLIAILVSTPPDLTFAFLNEQEEVQGELRAHKQLLSVRSSYFRQLFSDVGGVGVINLRLEHRRAVKALIAQVYNSADLPEILDLLDLPDLLALGSLGEEYDLPGVREAAEERLASFSLPPMEQAVMAAASEARKYPLLGEKLIEALHRNCAKTLLLTVRTDKQVKEFLKRHQDTEHELFSLKMKMLMNHIAKNPNRCDDKNLDNKEGVVVITQETLKKMRREKEEKERQEKQKLEKEEKLMSSRRKIDRRKREKGKEVVMTTGGVKGDEYNMDEVLAALGEIKKISEHKVKKRVAQNRTKARENEIPLSESESEMVVVELTSPCSPMNPSRSVNAGETQEVRLMNMASQELKTETGQKVLFDENLFDENLSDENLSEENPSHEHLESPQPVIQEMYEPAALRVENKKTRSHWLNLDAKEFVPRQSPTPPSWAFILPPDSTLPRDMRLSSPIPYNPQDPLAAAHQLSLLDTWPPYGYGSNNFAQRPCSPCQAEMSQHSPDVLSCPSPPVHPTIDQQLGLRTTIPGIVPVSPPFFAPVQPGHTREAAWDSHPSNVLQARMPLLVQSTGPGLPPGVLPAQPAHPLPVIVNAADMSRGEQPNLGSFDSIHQEGHHLSSSPSHHRWSEGLFISPTPSSPPMPCMSSSPPCPTSPEISFLQPSFLSPTYQRAKHVPPGF